MLRACEGPHTQPPLRVCMHFHEGEPRSPRAKVPASSRPPSYTGAVPCDPHTPLQRVGALLQLFH